MRGELHHLRPLRALDQEPVEVSLDFALMAATRHRERGETAAADYAAADAFWICFEGKHEQVSPARMITLLRGYFGTNWSPPTTDEVA